VKSALDVAGVNTNSLRSVPSFPGWASIVYDLRELEKIDRALPGVCTYHGAGDDECAELLINID
jgi:hypothetical protein